MHAWLIRRRSCTPIWTRSTRPSSSVMIPRCEAFLEVGGLLKIRGTPTEIATKLRADVREKVGLPITVGVARTKFLAKVASGVGKPDGLLVVPPGQELAFLHPLPVERLWGVGPITAGKLRDRQILTVGHV